MTTRAIVVGAHGGPEVMEWTEVDTPDPATGSVVVAVEAAGVNFIDTYHREGMYPLPVPFTPGLEGAGTVVALGAEVDDLSVGDVVAWTGVLGSYAESVAVPAAQAVPVPAGVDMRTAAATMLQGLTAHYLATSTVALEHGQRVLIHAGAGGVGLLLTQIAKMRGAEVFTTVGTAEKAALSQAAGADHVILYRDVDFAESIEEMAGERALDVVYDGVGRSVFDRSLSLVRPRGWMVTFGSASGQVPPVDPADLMRAGSVFLTRPSLPDYIATTGELRGRADELFGWVADGRLNVRIGAEFPLAEAADAHRALEGRQTTGKVLLIP